MPEDWAPSLADLALAKTLLVDDQIAIELAKFRDHWLARAGPHGVKLNWSATWRNWCRRAIEIHPHKAPDDANSRNGSSHNPRPKTLAGIAAERSRAASRA